MRKIMNAVETINMDLLDRANERLLESEYPFPFLIYSSSFEGCVVKYLDYVIWSSLNDDIYNPLEEDQEYTEKELTNIIKYRVYEYRDFLEKCFEF